MTLFGNENGLKNKNKKKIKCETTTLHCSWSNGAKIKKKKKIVNTKD